MDDLISRVRAAKGPDRELDGRIALHMGLVAEFFESHRVPFDEENVDGPEYFFGQPRWSGGGVGYEAPHFTSSIDAALALVEMKLPAKDGWRVTCYDIGSPESCAEIYKMFRHDEFRGYSPHPALAILLVLLVAMKEMGDG